MDRVGVNVLLNRELQYECFYSSYICLVTGYICTMFGSHIIPEKENINTVYFCHTVTDKKYPQDSGDYFGFCWFSKDNLLGQASVQSNSEIQSKLLHNCEESCVSSTYIKKGQNIPFLFYCTFKFCKVIFSK